MKVSIFSNAKLTNPPRKVNAISIDTYLLTEIRLMAYNPTYSIALLDHIYEIIFN